MGYNHNLEKTAAGMTFAEYQNAVKIARKKIDGRDTYGKWTRVINEAWSKGTSVAQCANFVSTMATGER